MNVLICSVARWALVRGHADSMKYETIWSWLRWMSSWVPNWAHCVIIWRSGGLSQLGGWWAWSLNLLVSVHTSPIPFRRWISEISIFYWKCLKNEISLIHRRTGMSDVCTETRRFRDHAHQPPSCDKPPDLQIIKI